MSHIVAGEVRAAQRAVNADHVAGWLGVGFAALLVVQNALRAAGAPANDAPASDVLRYVDSAQGTLSILLALFVPGLLALFGFVSGLLARARRLGYDSAWSTFGLIGVILIGGMFAASNAIEAALVASAPQLAADPSLVSLLWHFHTATFALNFAAIGAALLGLSRVSLAIGLISRPVALLALVGAGLLFAGAIPVVSVAAGSAWFYVALPGFGLWIVWLVATGVGLIRQ
jgi:hypothetical protein